MNKHEKINILRQYEVYCYQICHYIVQNEQFSSLAAEKALLKIAGDAHFYTDSEETRKKKVKRMSICTSLSCLTEPN